MARIKNPKKILVLALLFVCAYGGIKYLGLASKVPQDGFANNRANGILNAKYYNDIRKIENAIEQNPSLENLRRFPERTNLLYEQKNILLGGFASDTTTQAPTANTCLDTPFQEFSINELGNGVYEVQLDARQSWTDVITIEGPAEVEVSAERESRVCSAPDSASGPTGILGIAKYSRINAEHFPVGDAMYYSLIGRLDDSPGFTIGEGKKIAIPAGSHVLRMMANIREPWLWEAKGGHLLTMRVTK